MEEPIGKECKKCGKKIYGLTKKDLKYKMVLHSIKHNKEEEEKDGRKRRKEGRS